MITNDFFTYDTDNKKELAILLTQYEKYGTVGKDEVVQLVKEEFLEVDDCLNEYYDFLQDYYPDDVIYSMDEFDEVTCGMTAWEVARAAFYGDFCPAHDFFKFNAYGNLESMDRWKIEAEMEKSEEFKDWIMEKYFDFDPDEWDEIIDLANELIKQGM